jgi:hypothetical protein
VMMRSRAMLMLAVAAEPPHARRQPTPTCAVP